MIFRFLSLILLVWLLGFVWFAMLLPGPARQTEARAAVVLTGGPGRIARGVELLEQGRVEEIFVSGVDPEVTPEEFATEFKVSSRLMQCCVTLGYMAVDTRSNASETATWIEQRGHDEVRLVTTDWHMRRALADFRETVSPSVKIVGDAVPAKPPIGTLFLEYNKFLASRLYRLVPF